MILERELERIKITDLQLDKSNPNKMNQVQMQGLEDSMKRFGFLTPIIIDDETGKIADGEHRVDAYKKLGLTEIPAFRVKFKDDVERRLLRQTMNKLRGEHDRQLDADELALILKADRLDDLTRLIAQDKEDIQRLVLRFHPDLDYLTAENQADIDKLIDQELKKNAPDTQLGDIYQLGNHRLACGDCTDSRLLQRLLPDGTKVHQINTDPPYGVDLAERNTSQRERMPEAGGWREFPAYKSDSTNEDIQGTLTSLFQNVSSYLSDYNTIYVFMNGARIHEVVAAFHAADFHYSSALVWVKQQHVLSRTDYAMKHEHILYGWKGHHKFYGGFRTSIFEYDRPLRHEYHPAARPVELVNQIITDGTQKGDNVLDGFCGSGTIFIAAEQDGRNAYGFELDPYYCDVIVKRYEAFTGNKAQKVSDL